MDKRIEEQLVLDEFLSKYKGLSFTYKDRYFCALHGNPNNPDEVAFVELVYDEDFPSRELKEITDKNLYEEVFEVYKRIMEGV